MLVTASAWIWAKYSNSLCLSFPFPKEQLNTYQVSRDALRSYIISVSTAFSDNAEESAFLVLLKTELSYGNSAPVMSQWDSSKAKMSHWKLFPTLMGFESKPLPLSVSWCGVAWVLFFWIDLIHFQSSVGLSCRAKQCSLMQTMPTSTVITTAEPGQQPSKGLQTNVSVFQGTSN